MSIALQETLADATPETVDKTTPGIRASASAEVIVDSLESVFGSVPDNLDERISKASAEDLKRRTIEANEAILR